MARKREALPGGATISPKKRAAKPKAKKPATSRSPRKAGTTGSAGRKPSKPRAAKAPASKPPCKYGARVDGKCPKKPKAAKAVKAAEPKTVAEQILTKKIPGKRTTVQTAITRQVERKAGELTDRAVKKVAAQYKAGTLPESAKKVAGAAATVLPKIAAAGAVLALKGGPAPGQYVNAMRRATEKKLKRSLTASEWTALQPQYRSWVNQELAAGRDPLRFLPFPR